MDRKTLFENIEAAFQHPEIRERSFYPDFRRSWERLLTDAADSGESYSDPDAASVYPVPHSFDGIETVFHFDQLKIADWYRKEQSRGKRIVFSPTRLKHSRSGGLSFNDTPCAYDPNAAEPALTDDMRNVIAAALPGLPPHLQIVYGNKWVESRFNPFLMSRVSVFLIETDYVPAFLASPPEVALYLFMMDLCIIRENYKKVRDDELKKLLHIFRPSPMLRIKGLV